MSNPYAVKSMDSLIHHANVCLEQAFLISADFPHYAGVKAIINDECAELLLLEYSKRVDNILFHL